MTGFFQKKYIVSFRPLFSSCKMKQLYNVKEFYRPKFIQQNSNFIDNKEICNTFLTGFAKKMAKEISSAF